MKEINLTGDAAERFDAARQEAEKQTKTDVSEDVKAVRSMTSEDPCDGGVEDPCDSGARILIDLAKLDQFATEYAQDKHLPDQTKAAVIAGATWVCKNPCPGSLSGLLTNDLTGEFQKKMQKAMAEVMANDKMTKFVSQWEGMPAEHQKIKAGNWYMCFKEVKNKDLVTVFRLGETYFCPKDGYLDVDGALFKVGTLDAFRLFIQGEEKSPEWSEEDEDKLGYIINKLRTINDEKHFSCIWWLKSLRPQNTWKPAKLPKGEDYGIDGLYAAIDILEITLGKVDGYQSNDGILEHQCAISAVKKLYEESEQKPAWSEEDEKYAKDLADYFTGGLSLKYAEEDIANWFKSLKDRVQPKWKPSDEQMNTLNKVREILHYKELWNKTNTIIFSYESLIRDLEQLKAL